jgi:hypothetical protein
MAETATIARGASARGRENLEILDTINFLHKSETVGTAVICPGLQSQVQIRFCLSPALIRRRCNIAFTAL